LNNVLFVVLFSVLLLVPIGAQQVFGTHPTQSCPGGGALNTNPAFTFQGTSNFCLASGFGLFPPCNFPYTSGNVLGFVINPVCVALVITAPPTPTGVCQNGAVLDGTGHCVCEQQQCVGGVIIDTDTVSLLAGAIGIDPLLTGLIGITIGGLAVQAVWFVHRRKNGKKS